MGHFKHSSSCSNTQPNLFFFFFFFSVVFVYWRETVYERGGRAEGGRQEVFSPGPSRLKCPANQNSGLHLRTRKQTLTRLSSATDSYFLSRAGQTVGPRGSGSDLEP